MPNKTVSVYEPLELQLKGWEDYTRNKRIPDASLKDDPDYNLGWTAASKGWSPKESVLHKVYNVRKK